MRDWPLVSADGILYMYSIHTGCTILQGVMHLINKDAQYFLPKLYHIFHVCNKKIEEYKLALQTQHVQN